MLIEVQRGTSAQPFHIRVTEATLLAKSETYFNRVDALATANKLKVVSQLRFETFVTNSPTHPYSWHILASNGKKLVSSVHMYGDHAEANRVMVAVKTALPYAEVKDLT